MISSAVFGMTKSSKFHLLAVGAIFVSWLGVYSLFSHGYTLETLRSTPLFSHELFFASQSGGSLGELIFITVLGLFVVSSLVRWLEQWIKNSDQPWLVLFSVTWRCKPVYGCWFGCYSMA